MDHTDVNQPPHMLGLRHLALRVVDIERSKAFYARVFGMRPVWEPDPLNSYLSSGSDNLALHQISSVTPSRENAHEGALDHFGFLMENPEAVDEMFLWVKSCQALITKEPKQHRDGSYSFYMADPDGNTIQILYEPNVTGPSTNPAR
ncbi:MAG TPA: VOC family protein [Nitrospirales bacterium]|nr:VOC family protein [Nitrospirales bacterium]HIA13821.1 VOC family protein [Nitrospirales bacterium]HIB54003.1 VOC family protein [Nitrospirales bacterium]HIC03996.1 VOC family protein [Nitrospirales bacterium]HIN33868.1 VOC family protein [Nitrospirales bacterium]